MNVNLNIKTLTYRKGVIGIVVDIKNNFLIIQSVNYKENEWRFPGGGIEENETPEKAMIRELQEELGTDKFKIIKISKFKNKYDWSLKTIEWRFKEKGKTYKGQEQIQFLVQFYGDRKDIKINKKELRNLKWVKYNDLKHHLIFPDQWKQDEKTIKELKYN